jgi:hypothetical protein
VPAAAVIPALIVYIKVVAVKKLVVEFWTTAFGPPSGEYWSLLSHLLDECTALHRVVHLGQDVYCEKIRVFKAGVCLNILAWNNGIGLWSYFVGF